ncbi:MSF1-domain-containing protein [Gloeopeniophorella convolvens]|nr:MSF1-domain-containing protein [Gloeopeniophorella convolvens]
MKFFSQSFLYDDPWPIVTLAFYLRYPNPYASHVLSCDVISRDFTPSGSLLTTRLILKSATLPRWAPKGIISRSESWILEESEVDPQGKVVRCRTRNLEHTKAMQVHESQTFSQVEEGKTLQTTEARIVSGFGWGLTKQIENYGIARFRKNVQRSRDGVVLILDLIRQARRQPMTVASSYLNPTSASRLSTAPRIPERLSSEPHQFTESSD